MAGQSRGSLAAMNCVERHRTTALCSAVMLHKVSDRNELKSSFAQAGDDGWERLCSEDATIIHVHDDDASIAR